MGGGKADNDDLQKAVNALVAAHEDRTELIDGFEKFEKEELASIDALHAERAARRIVTPPAPSRSAMKTFTNSKKNTLIFMLFFNRISQR